MPIKTFTVVQHSTGPSGGYVVRTAWDGALAAPYQDAIQHGSYRRHFDAQRLASKLNRLDADIASGRFS